MGLEGVRLVLAPNHSYIERQGRQLTLVGEFATNVGSGDDHQWVFDPIFCEIRPKHSNRYHFSYQTSESNQITNQMKGVIGNNVKPDRNEEVSWFTPLLFDATNLIVINGAQPFGVVG